MKEETKLGQKELKNKGRYKTKSTGAIGMNQWKKRQSKICWAKKN